jgi:hypothetical protein
MSGEIQTLVEEAKSIAEDAGRSFGSLSTEQLNWRPGANEWSVAQCLDHLVVINSGYFPVLARIEGGQFRPSFKERLPLVPRLFGSLVLKAVRPETQFKSKADPRFGPCTSGIDSGIVTRFIAHQREIIEHMERTAHLDLSRLIITSPVLGFVTYSLLDAYRIIVAHERRHLAQAKRVMNAEGFPVNERGAH